MIKLHKLAFMVASAAFFIAGQASAQNAGTVTAHAFVIGQGAGHSGYTSLLCGSAQLAVGQSAADPICKTITGDVTLSATGVTAIGAGKVASSMLADTAVAAGSYGSSSVITTFTVNSKGQITAASNATAAIPLGQITGLGTGIATWLATPSSSNLASAVTDETGSGKLVFGTSPTLASPTITTPSGLVKGDVGLGNVDNTSDATKWAATATLTNKTFDTAGAGNSLKINGTAISDKTGTGKVVLDTSPALAGTPTAPTASPSDNSDKIATTAYVDAQVASGVSGVASFNGRTGVVVPSAGDYDVAHGGTGTTNLIGFISGLQPLKLGGSVIGVNPGAWANNTGTAVFSSTDVMHVNLQAAVPDFTQTPALGAQVSGALTATANSTDGTEVFLYLVHRNSDGKPALIGSSSDTQGPNNRTFTVTAASPGVFTFATTPAFRKRMPIYFSNSGGALPSPLAANTQYYICTVPSTTTFTVATTIANVNSGTCLATTTTGSGTNTATWGVQADLDFQLGSGVATFDRRLPYLAFVWSWSKYGSGGVPGGTNGIPDFQTAQGSTDTLLTNAGQAASFRALLQGTATSFTAIDLSPWLANINRRVLVFTYCDFPSTAGGCFMRATGSGGPGIQVGAPSTATIGVTGLYSFQTDSTSKIDYKVTGGARLSVFVMGWTQVDPS